MELKKGIHTDTHTKLTATQLILKPKENHEKIYRERTSKMYV